MNKVLRWILLSLAAAFSIAGNTSAFQVVTDSLIPDTVYVINTVGSSSNFSVVPINFTNDEPLRGIEITLTWNSAQVTLDSVSFVGGRVEYTSIKGATIMNDTVVIYTFPLSEADIAPGFGHLCRLFYSHAANLGPLTVDIDSTYVEDGTTLHANFFSDVNASQFVPQFVKGQLTFVGSTCCIGSRGNVNYSTPDEPDISDLTYLVDYFFGNGPAPPCMLEANVDGSLDEQVDISDLTSLVDYFFNGAGPLPACP